jgi:hypothetical protein
VMVEGAVNRVVVEVLEKVPLRISEPKPCTFDWTIAAGKMGCGVNQVGVLMHVCSPIR